MSTCYAKDVSDTASSFKNRKRRSSSIFAKTEGEEDFVDEIIISGNSYIERNELVNNTDEERESVESS